MKALILIPLALLAGCASTEYTQYAKAQSDIATARANSDASRYQALAAIASKGDSASSVAAVMAIAIGGGSQQAQQVAAPQASQAWQWASILVPGLTQVAGMRYSYLSQQTASNNATALGISTNSTFAGIAGKIQAPGAITTLSGTGTMGSGAYGITDRHDVTSPAPTVITPVVQVVPVITQDAP